VTLKVQGTWEAERLADVLGLYATHGIRHKEWAADLEKRIRLQIRKRKDERDRT